MDREKVIKGLQEIVDDNWMKTHADWYVSVCSDALALINEQKETIQITKNVAERYANILADKGVNGVWVRYAVKKGKHFMAEYQNKKASWCYGLDRAWMTFDREMAEGFAKLTNGKLIEVTLTERPLKVTGKLTD